MRIIAGTAKGRRLFTPSNRDIRPTSDRVRENLFNILAARVVHARFLDLFCGVGAAGIEALSRGALHATFVDNHPVALNLTRRNIDLCGFGAWSDCLKQTLPQNLQPYHGPYTLIFADPPYSFTQYDELLIRLAHADILAPEGMVILETSCNCSVPQQTGTLAFQQRRRYGDTALLFFS